MQLGIPKPGHQSEPVPDYHDLDWAIRQGKVKVRGRLRLDDWRRELADDDGGWLAWFELDDDDRVIIGLGLIEHAKDENAIRKKGFVSVRPFTRRRTQIPLACIVGTVAIADRERASWARVDTMALKPAASALSHGKWWMIREAPEGGPMSVFSPARWRNRPKAEGPGLETAGRVA